MLTKHNILTYKRKCMLKISSASDFAIYLAYHMAQTSSSHRGIGCHWALAPEGTSNVSQDITEQEKVKQMLN